MSITPDKATDAWRMRGAICMEDKTTGYVEMTNEEYREELKKMFDGVDNNALLQYFYILLPKLIKEWN